MADAAMTFVDADPQNWTTVDNSFLNAGDLSWKATALLIYLKGRPPGWTVRPSQLAKVKRDGIDSVKSGLRELEEAGYLRRERTRDEQGRITGVVCHFSWHRRWSDPRTDFPPVENPPEAFPPVEDRPLVSTEVQQGLSEATTDSRRSRSEACDPEALAIAEVLAAFVAQLPGARKKIDPTGWVSDIEKLLRIDGAEAGEVLDFIEWLHTSDSETATFWRVNIRSGAKLRKQWEEVQVRRAAEEAAAKRRQARQQVERPSKTTTTRFEDSQHPVVGPRRRGVPEATWAFISALPPGDRAWEAEGAADAAGLTLEEACRLAGRDPVTFERVAVA